MTPVWAGTAASEFGTDATDTGDGGGLTFSLFRDIDKSSTWSSSPSSSPVDSSLDCSTLTNECSLSALIFQWNKREIKTIQIKSR